MPSRLLIWPAVCPPTCLSICFPSELDHIDKNNQKIIKTITFSLNGSRIFFLISNYFIKEERLCTQEVYTARHTEGESSTAHMSSISDKELQCTKLEAFNQSYKVCQKEDFRAGIGCSSPSKTLLFRSRHMHHMRQ